MSKTNIIYASKDTFISTELDSKSINFGNDGNLVIDKFSKIFLYFDLSSIPENAIITSAKLQLYLYEFYSYNFATVSINQLNSNFYEYTVTADTGLKSKPLPSTDVNAKKIAATNINKVITFNDLTNTVAAWHSATSSNHGLELSTSSDSTLSFFSRECNESNLVPKLEVEYNITIHDIESIKTNTVQDLIYLKHNQFVESRIYYVSNSLFFNYFIYNKYPLPLYVYVKTCNTINGTFETIGDLLLIDSNTNKSLELLSTNKYVCLSVLGSNNSALNIDATYKSFSNMLPSRVRMAQILKNKITLTMTEPLIGNLADTAAFTIISPKYFDNLPAIEILKISIDNLTVTLTISPDSIFFPETTLSYIATGTNNLTSIGGDVFNFTKENFYFDPYVVVAPIEYIVPSSREIETTIYIYSKATSFNYFIELTNNFSASVYVKGYDSITNPTDIITTYPVQIDNFYLLSIDLEPKYTYISLVLTSSYIASQNLGTNSENIIKVLPYYRARNKVPPTISSISISTATNKQKIILKMTESLYKEPAQNFPSGIFTISTSLNTIVTPKEISISDKTITLLLTKSNNINLSDFVNLTYRATDSYFLKSEYGNVDNFTNFEIDLPLINVSINEDITIRAFKNSVSTIYNISKAASFSYTISNNLKIDSRSVSLLQSNSIDGKFTIINTYNLNPYSTFNITVSKKYKYAYLSFFSDSTDTKLELAYLTINYTTSSNFIPAVLISADLIGDGKKILLTFTKQLNSFSGDITNKNIFTISNSINTNFIVNHLIVFGKTALLTTDISIPQDAVQTITFKGTSKFNYLTGKNGDVDNFTNFKLGIDSEKLTAKKVTLFQNFTPTLEPIQTTIYGFEKANSFQYTIINPNENPPVSITQLNCKTRNGLFTKIAGSDIINLPGDSEITISIAKCDAYLCLSVTGSNSENKPLLIRASYDAYPNYIPALISSAQLSAAGDTISLIFNKPLYKLTNEYIADDIFTLSPSLDTKITALTILDETVTLQLNNIISEDKCKDIILTLTYEDNNTNYLRDITSNVDNFSNFKINTNISTNLITIPECILPSKKEGTQSTIYDRSRIHSFEYTINNPTSKVVSIIPKYCDTKTGSFINIFNYKFEINPYSFIKLPIEMFNYICLYIIGDDFTDTELIHLTATYNTSSTVSRPYLFNTRSTPGGHGDKKEFIASITMSKPLFMVQPDKNAFTVYSNLHSKLNLKGILISTNSITGLTTLDFSLDNLPKYISVSYKALGGDNDLKGADGIVDNFTNYSNDLLEAPCYSFQIIQLLGRPILSNIYNLEKALTFKYIITNNSKFNNINVSALSSNSKIENSFVPVPDTSVTIPPNSSSEIIIKISLTTPRYIRLSIITHALEKDSKLFITTEYTAFSYRIPATIESTELVSNADGYISTINLTTTKQLTIKDITTKAFTINSSSKCEVIGASIKNTSTLCLEVSPILRDTSHFTITYNATEDNELTGINGDMDNFTDYSDYLKINKIEIKEPSTLFENNYKTIIYDTRKALAFKYTINNNSTTELLLITLVDCTTRQGPFSKNKTISILPNSNESLDVLDNDRYVCLLIDSYINSTPPTININYTTFEYLIPSTPQSHSMEDIDSNTLIYLKMSKPLSNYIADPAAFTIISGTKLSVSSATCYIKDDIQYLCLTMPQFLRNIDFSISYNATGLNDLTGINGAVDNFYYH